MKTIPSTMQQLNHKHLDVLKIDIEGGEFEVFAQLARDGFLRGSNVGQIQVEVHHWSDEHVWRLFHTLHRSGFAVFHKELNVLYTEACEYALRPIVPAPSLLAARPANSFDYSVVTPTLQQYFVMHRESLANCTAGRFLIFRCIHQDDCGGVGDRFSGMITAFAFALLTNRAFIVQVDRFDGAFVPAGAIDWRLSDELRACLGEPTQRDFVNNLPTPFDVETLIGHDRVVSVRSNRGALWWLFRSERYAAALRELGLTNPCTAFGQLFDRVLELVEQINAKYIRESLLIASHLRFGDDVLLSNEQAATSVHPTHREQLVKLVECMKSIEEAALSVELGSFDEYMRASLSRFVVLSDNPTVVRHLTTIVADVAPPEHFVQIPWRPTHINQKVYRPSLGGEFANVYQDDVIRTYAEWLLISRADVAVVPLSSGFRRTAVYASLARRNDDWAEYAIIDSSTCVALGRRYVCEIATYGGAGI
jgi:hypothetical protein